MIAALYVDPRGPYPAMAGVDAWDESRDARAYAGPAPVVAHPPCGPWGKLKHQYAGAEHECGPRAVEQVQRFGGVLEHPAGSDLWNACDLPRPGGRRDLVGGYTIEVSQVDWGHVARKSTWLYLVGVPRAAITAPPFPGREPTHWLSGSRGVNGRNAKSTGGAPPPGIKICSAPQRRRTPPLFAAWLVGLARSVRP